jgi:hypothetical protein
VERLGELSPFVEELFVTGVRLALSVLGRSQAGANSAEWQSVWKADANDVQAFRQEHRDRLATPFYEARVPIPSPAQPDDTKPIESEETPKLHCWPFQNSYYETELAPNWRMVIANFIDRTGNDVRTLREEHIQRGEPLPPDVIPQGFKLRCGGLNADAFPPAEQIAFAIVRCRDANVPFKATAGLHHPIRRYRDEVKAKMHGFLNVFGGGVLANANWLSVAQLQDIILDENAEHFTFDDEGFNWRDGRQSYHASLDQIKTARLQLMHSFGSCSFDEPREDLRAMGLL